MHRLWRNARRGDEVRTLSVQYLMSVGRRMNLSERKSRRVTAKAVSRLTWRAAAFVMLINPALADDLGPVGRWGTLDDKTHAIGSIVDIEDCPAGPLVAILFEIPKYGKPIHWIAAAAAPTA